MVDLVVAENGAPFFVPKLDKNYHASQATPTFGRAAITWYFRAIVIHHLWH